MVISFSSKFAFEFIEHLCREVQLVTSKLGVCLLVYENSR